MTGFNWFLLLWCYFGNVNFTKLFIIIKPEYHVWYVGLSRFQTDHLLGEINIYFFHTQVHFAYIKAYPVFIYSSYSSPSSLFWAVKVLRPMEGVEQGDPFGHLLFCLSNYHIYSWLQSELWFLYLDDITIGGILERIQHDLQVIKEKSPEIGLTLNHQKSQLFGVTLPHVPL